MIRVRSEIIEYGGTPMAPWLLHLESLAAVRALAQNLLQVSYQNSDGKRFVSVDILRSALEINASQLQALTQLLQALLQDDSSIHRDPVTGDILHVDIHSLSLLFAFHIYLREASRVDTADIWPNESASLQIEPSSPMKLTSRAWGAARGEAGGMVSNVNTTTAAAAAAPASGSSPQQERVAGPSGSNNHTTNSGTKLHVSTTPANATTATVATGPGAKQHHHHHMSEHLRHQEALLAAFPRYIAQHAENILQLVLDDPNSSIAAGDMIQPREFDRLSFLLYIQQQQEQQDGGEGGGDQDMMVGMDDNSNNNNNINADDADDMDMEVCHPGMSSIPNATGGTAGTARQASLSLSSCAPIFDASAGHHGVALKSAVNWLADILSAPNNTNNNSNTTNGNGNTSAAVGHAPQVGQGGVGLDNLLAMAISPPKTPVFNRLLSAMNAATGTGGTGGGTGLPGTSPPMMANVPSPGSSAGAEAVLPHHHNLNQHLLHPLHPMHHHNHPPPPAPAPACCSPHDIYGASKVTVVKGEDAFPDGHIRIIECRDAVIYALAPLDYALISCCSDCVIVVGAVGKSLRVERCERVQVIAVATQVSVNTCHDCILYLGVNLPPLLLGDNRFVQLAPYNSGYDRLKSHMEVVGVSGEVNCWDRPVSLAPDHSNPMKQHPTSSGLYHHHQQQQHRLRGSSGGGGGSSNNSLQELLNGGYYGSGVSLSGLVGGSNNSLQEMISSLGGGGGGGRGSPAPASAPQQTPLDIDTTTTTAAAASAMPSPSNSSMMMMASQDQMTLGSPPGLTPISTKMKTPPPSSLLSSQNQQQQQSLSPLGMTSPTQANNQINETADALLLAASQVTLLPPSKLAPFLIPFKGGAGPMCGGPPPVYYNHREVEDRGLLTDSLSTLMSMGSLSGGGGGNKDGTGTGTGTGIDNSTSGGNPASSSSSPSCDNFPSSPFTLPPLYAEAWVDKMKGAAKVRRLVTSAQLDEGKKKELMAAIQVQFKEWLQATGNMKSIYDLARMENASSAGSE